MQPQRKQYRDTQMPLALALNLDGGLQPPRGRVAAGSSGRKPTLTETFNKAAKQPVLSSVVKQPVSKLQIDALRRKMSQPKPSYDYSPMGSVNNARNPAKDRLLIETMTALTEQLGKNKGLSQKFAVAEKKGQLKRDFNQSSLGMGK